MRTRRTSSRSGSRARRPRARRSRSSRVVRWSGRLRPPTRSPSSAGWGSDRNHARPFARFGRPRILRPLSERIRAALGRITVSLLGDGIYLVAIRFFFLHVLAQFVLLTGDDPVAEQQDGHPSPEQRKIPLGERTQMRGRPNRARRPGVVPVNPQSAEDGERIERALPDQTIWPLGSTSIVAPSGASLSSRAASSSPRPRSRPR